MRLIDNTNQLQDYVAVSAQLDWELVAPYVEQAERKHILPLLGKEVFEQIATANTNEKKEIKKLFAGASANLGLLRALPVIAVKISNTGITVTDNDKTKQAEWWQQKDLRRTLQTYGYEAIDAGLIELETSDTFPDWKDSDNYTVFKELLVNTADKFNRWFNINRSRLTFLALKPFLLEVNEEKILPALGEETLTVVRTEANATIKKVSGYLVAAMVAYTIVKVSNQSTFELTPSGLFYRWEELPGEKAKLVDANILRRIADEKETAGDEYMKKALKLIKANPDIFPDYTETTPAEPERIITKKSILGL